MDWTFYAIGIPLTVVMIAAMLLLAARGNRKFAAETARELTAARALGGAARARIVDFRRAEVQRYRRRDLTTFKFLIEVYPGDLQPAFTASVVWELEPQAVNALRRGAIVPVVFDRANLRRIFPETPGAHYFQENQHAFLGIENDFQPEEIVAAAALGQQSQQQFYQPTPPIAPYAPAPNTIYRKRSPTVVFGLPLWEIAFNVVNKKGRMRYVKSARARAIIAVGDSATGVVAVGGFAKGLIAVGQFSVGLISFGVFSIGLLGGGAFGLGLLSVGLFGVGLLSIAAAFNVGYVAIALLPFYGKYRFGKDFQSPELLPVHEMLKTWTGMSDLQLSNAAAAGFLALIIVSFGFLIISLLAQFLAVQMLQPNDNRLDSPR